MNISTGLMDLYFNYNGRVGDVEGLSRDAEEYKHLAETAETPEQRERYANAVTQIKTELLPTIKKQMDEMANQLGLLQSQKGSAISLEDLKGPNIGLSKNPKGAISFFNSYQSGSYLSEET